MQRLGSAAERRAVVIDEITASETTTNRLKTELVLIDQEIAGQDKPKQPIDRAACLETVRRIVKEAFPAYVVKTNDGLNPGTPLGVSLYHQDGRHLHSEKAGSVGVDPEVFAQEAIERMKKWLDIRRKGLA